MQIETILVVAAPNSIDPTNPKIFVRQEEPGVLNFSLLTFPLEKTHTTITTADYLLNSYLGIRARIGNRGCVDLIPSPVVDNVDRVQEGKRVLGVPYGCVIPLEISSHLGQWRTLTELLFSPEITMVHDHKDILMSVCSKF